MSAHPVGYNTASSKHHVNSNRTKQQSPTGASDYRGTNGQTAISPSRKSTITNKSNELQQGSMADTLIMRVPPALTPSPANVNGSTNGASTTAQHSDSQDLRSNGAHAQVKGKERDITSLDGIPLSQLEQELPLEDADLVPLAALVERLANYGYESLQNMAETMSSLPSSSRRVKVFNTALDVRKQFIKLLVLARWSTDVADLQKARNIISLLSEQQWQHEDVFAGLTEVRKILPNARMRDADLPTAIDVLRTGTYRRLPTSIKDMAVAQPAFSDKDAVAVVARLDEALRTRMLCHEAIPALLSHYTIRDGKVHFKVNGLFEARLTASGDGPPPSDSASTPASDTDRWWLLDLQFDVDAVGTGAESAMKAFPAKPKQAYRERLRVWGDQELAPRTSTQAEQPKEVIDDQGQDVPMPDASKSVEDVVNNRDLGADASQTRDTPLVRLFAFLQERSLHYQLDILQHQAYELCRLNWGTNLRIETQERPRSLILHYWTKAQSNDPSSTVATGPAAGGSVHISLVDMEQQHGFNRAITDLLDDSEDAAELSANAISIKRRGLRVTWTADPTILDIAGLVDPSISSHKLNVEQVLSDIVQRHSSALLRHLQRQILVGEHKLAGLLRPEDCTLGSEAGLRQSDDSASDRLQFLKIDLQGSRRRRLQRSSHAIPPLRLHVDIVSGRLLLEAEESASDETFNDASGTASLCLTSFTASTLTTRPTLASLAEATERLNSSISSVFDVLHRLDIFARVGEWERKVSQIGLRSVRKINLGQLEWIKFGPSVAVNGPPLLFIPLGNTYAGYFLALQPSELNSVSVALICVAQMTDSSGASSLAMQSIEWLDRAKIASVSVQTPATNSVLGKRKHAIESQIGAVAGHGQGELAWEEISSIHSYSVALVSYYRVEQQLRMRGIPYMHIAPSDGPSADKRQRVEQETASGVDALVPTLCLRVSDLVGASTSSLCKPNGALRVRDWRTHSKTRVEIAIKLKMKSRRFRSLKTVFAPQTWAEFDAATSVLTYSTKDLGNCIGTFQLHWAKIAPTITLTREVLNVSRAWQQRALLSRQKAAKPETVIELRRFTFNDVVFSYGHGVEGNTVQLLVRVQWQDDSAKGGGYVLQFGSIPQKAIASADSFYAATTSHDGVEHGDPAGTWFIGDNAASNPHNVMAFELRRTINTASQRPAHRGMWRGFFQLLTNTLPLIRELEPLLQLCLEDANAPELEIRGATWFRLRFIDRYALDLRLVSRSRLLVCDASQPLFRSPIKGLSTASASDGVFTGSQMLESMILGQATSENTSEFPHTDSMVQTTMGTSQFSAIPNFDTVCNGVSLLDDGQDRKVWDLRRALLISLPTDADKSGLLHTLIPALIDQVQAQIQAL